MLKEFIEELKTSLHFDHEKIIVGGFSQGAVMAYNIGLTEPGLIHGIIALSGRLLGQLEPFIKAERSDILEILIIHGTQDRLLPLTYARQTKSDLQDETIRIDYNEIETGHAITNESVELMNKWLLKV